MAIIGCRLFEDELVHVLSLDKGIGELVVVDDAESSDLVNKLKRSGIKRKVILIPAEGLAGLKRPKGFSVLVWVKPMALHQKPEKLREDILDSIAKLGAVSDSVLLFYGLCGNAFRHIEDDTKASDSPVMILRDARGEIIDDCIGCALGGTEEYLDQLRGGHGTFFLTPMWAANWRDLFHKVQILQDPNDVEGAKYIFKCVGYHKVIKMETGLGDRDEFERNVDEFSRLFEFERGTIDCSTGVVESAYAEAKKGTLRATS